MANAYGVDKWEDIETFGRAKESWFRRYLELPHEIPSHDTLARVFALLDPEQFSRCFLSWIRAINPGHEQEIINIHGKTLRRSHGEGKSAIHMVSAWANKAGLTLGQVKVDEKSNEITAIPELLELPELKGCIVTIGEQRSEEALFYMMANPISSERGCRFAVQPPGSGCYPSHSLYIHPHIQHFRWRIS